MSKEISEFFVNAVIYSEMETMSAKNGQHPTPAVRFGVPPDFPSR
jgi:hypothetical protein